MSTSIDNGPATGSAQRFSRTRGMFKSYLGSSMHGMGKEWFMNSFGMGYVGHGVKPGDAAKYYEGARFTPAEAGKLRPLKGIFGKVVGPALLAYSMYEGYQKEGVYGAVKEGVQGAATGYAFGAAWGALKGVIGVGGPIALSAAAVAGGAYGYKEYRGAVKDHMRRQAAVEMGRPTVDQFGTVATMRQRSLAAIQDSKLNGRVGLGNEATLMYRPY